MSTPLNYIDENIKTFESQLFDLLRIPSVSTDSRHKGDVKKAAQFLIDQLNDIGLDKVTLHETPGHPIITAEKCPHRDKPTVLIYGHYDVQPSDPDELWETPPFEPTVKNGRVYARVASDDKGQSYTHIKAVESFLKTGTLLPVNVKFILEGEEEIGGESLPEYLRRNASELATDHVLVWDGGFSADDYPSLVVGDLRRARDPRRRLGCERLAFQRAVRPSRTARRRCPAP